MFQASFDPHRMARTCCLEECKSLFTDIWSLCTIVALIEMIRRNTRLVDGQQMCQYKHGIDNADSAAPLMPHVSSAAGRFTGSSGKARVSRDLLAHSNRNKIRLLLLLCNLTLTNLDKTLSRNVAL
jgi:hypothetical protein